MDLETVWYEVFPFVYGLGGVLVLSFSAGSTLLKVAGVSLIIASLAILRARRTYRRAIYYELPSIQDTESIEATPES